jgi:quinoprotein dehydrogenase-associated probable ABC transporter substrate-binding protein
MTSSVPVAKRLGWALTLAVLVGLAGTPGEAADGARVDLVNRQVLRVCSDPGNMPFSNDKGEGFENKVANIVADELKIPVEYTYFPMATGFIRKTLFSKACDVVIGYAQGDELVLNTNAYYRTSYALVYPKGKGLDGVHSLADPKLQGKRLGIIAGTPPANIMAKQGLMALAKPYHLVVDRRFESPGEDMINDIRKGEIAGGILWGPIAGYYAKHGGEELTVVPLIDEGTGSSRLIYRISMGVRNGEDDWKRQLNAVIGKRQSDINKVLLEFGVPLLDEQNQRIVAATKP